VSVDPSGGWHYCGGAEFAGPENDEPKNNNIWKVHIDLENDGPNHWAGKCSMKNLEIDRPRHITRC